MLSKIRKYYLLDKEEKKLILNIFFSLIYATILARFIPLRWFDNTLGAFNKECQLELDVKQKNAVRLVIKNTKRIKKHVPWKVKCFEEAICLKRILNTYKIQSILYLGVNKTTENKLIAHAWLKAGEEIISGKAGYTNFVVTGFYC